MPNWMDPLVLLLSLDKSNLNSLSISYVLFAISSTYEYGFQTIDWSCLNIPATPTVNSAVHAKWVRDRSYGLHSLHHSLSNPSLPPLSRQLHSVYPNGKNHCIWCPFPYPRETSCFLYTHNIPTSKCVGFPHQATSQVCAYTIWVSAFSLVLLTLNCPRLVQTSWVNGSVLQDHLLTSDANQGSSPWVTQTFLKLSCTHLLSMTFPSCSIVCCKSL